MTPTYKSELRGKLRGLYEIRDKIMPEIAQLEEVLGVRRVRDGTNTKSR
jgi:hypothetical protein